MLVSQLPVLPLASLAAVLHHPAVLELLQGGQFVRLDAFEHGAIPASNALGRWMDFEGRVDNACSHP